MRQLVPHFILEKYLANETRGSLPAAGIFVDLSGFSAMTDALARHGQLGAETLTQVMRGIFEPLVEAVYAQGGFVVGYAGDAFQAIFLEAADRAPAALRGLAAVAAIQEHTRVHPRVGTSFGEFPISLKAGLGYGEVTWLLLNSSDHSQATYCVRGSSVDNSVEAEENARPGQIVLDAASQARLAEWAETTPAAAGFHRVERLSGELPAPRPFHMPQVDPVTLGLFYPESVIRQPNAGEFRPVVNVFIDIPIDPTDEAFVTPFMENVFLLQKRYDGFFLRPDLGDKGFNLLLFWGATTVHENNVERALNFLLDLYVETKVPFRAGVSYRQAYSGFMGASVREDYTAYGWGVNLAARMMSASGRGEVWLEEEVARRAERHFELHPLGEYSFKGFSHKIKTFVLEGRKQAAENIYRGRMVGREAELARWEEFSRPLARGEFAGVLMIKGEAGIGKSRLVYEFQHSPQGETLQWVLGQTDEILRQSLNPFEAWLRTRFQFSDDQPDEVNWRSFDERLSAIVDATPDPELVTELTRTRTVLAALLDLTEPGSLYDLLDAKGRYENIFIALSNLLLAESLRQPLVLLIEDLHWLDEDTRAFLPYLVRNALANPEKIFPLAILTTTRPEGVFPALNDPALLHEIQLERLPSEGLSRLAGEILESPASPALIGLLERRSEGNPFFAEQILRYLAENGLLLRLADGSFSAPPRSENSIPTDVNSVLIARLDKLTREVREVVQTASVLGREFELRLLAEMLRGDPHFADKIVSAERSDIWFALNELAHIFRHALLRDAAYSMQLETRRQNLHAIALTALETLHSADLIGHYSELGYHAERAVLDKKALHYLVLAGQTAVDTYRNIEALDYYTRALRLVPEGDLGTAFQVRLAREKVYAILGQQEEWQTELDALARLADLLGDAGSKAEAVYRLASRQYLLGNYQEAVQKAYEAIEWARQAGNRSLETSAAMLVANNLHHLGNYREAISQVEAGLQMARQAANWNEEAHGYNLLGLISMEEKTPEAASAYFNQALKIFKEHEDLTGQAMTLNSVGLVNSVIGNFSAAQAAYEQALILARQLGIRRGEGVLLGNLGFIAGLLGNFKEARANCERMIRIAGEIGDRYGETMALINLSSNDCALGNYAAAVQSARQALDYSRQSGDRNLEAWALTYLGHATFESRQLEEALQSYQEAFEIRRELDQMLLAMEPCAGLARINLSWGKLTDALEHAQVILDYLAPGNTLDGTDQPLRIYLNCYLVLREHDDPRAGDILQAAYEILNTHAANIPDEAARRVFLEEISHHREIVAAWNSRKLA